MSSRYGFQRLCSLFPGTLSNGDLAHGTLRSAFFLSAATLGVLISAIYSARLSAFFCALCVFSPRPTTDGLSILSWGPRPSLLSPQELPPLQRPSTQPVSRTACLSQVEQPWPAVSDPYDRPDLALCAPEPPIWPPHAAVQVTLRR